MTDALNPEQHERELALYAAYRMTIGDESLDACDVIDFAEYIRTGARGVPLDEQPAIHFPRGHEITRAWLDETHIWSGTNAPTSRP